ncbi:MAG: hypothetical protein GQ526_09355 [Ardenticatenales bacterium]|nr:hypothetical protein [Ardenticatenales bacterium]
MGILLGFLIGATRLKKHCLLTCL